MNVPKTLIVHHTGGSNADPLSDSSNFTFDQCNDLHKQEFNMRSSLGWYVGYHYYISKDGSVRQARADTDEGAHTIGQNSSSLGICLAGNFDATYPTEGQITSLTILLTQKTLQYSIPLENIVPHRHYATKTCYGNRLPDNWASMLIMTKEQKFQRASALLAEATSLLRGII